MIIACMLFAAAAYTFTACNSAEEPVIAQPDGQTTPMTRAATIENFARHLIVEVNDVNISMPESITFPTANRSLPMW